MANKTVTVKSSGGDYTSLNAALAGESTDLVSTLDGVLTIECYAMTDTTAADTGTGYTTDANHYILITVPAGQRHAGKWTTGKYILAPDAQRCLLYRESYTKIRWIQVDCIWTPNIDGHAITNNETTIDGCEVSGCIVRCSATASNGRTGIFFRSSTGENLLILNNIVYGFQSGMGIYVLSATTATNSLVANNTTYNCSTGFYNNNKTYLKNNLSYSNTDNYGGEALNGSTNNLSGPDQSDAPGSWDGERSDFAGYSR